MKAPKVLQVPVTLIIAIVSVAYVHSESSADLKCSPPDPKKTVNLTIEWGNKEVGNWLTEFTIRGGPEEIAELKSLEIFQTVIKCNGEDVVQIKGRFGGFIDHSAPADVEIVALKGTPAEQKIVAVNGGPVEVENVAAKEGPVEVEDVAAKEDPVEVESAAAKEDPVEVESAAAKEVKQNISETTAKTELPTAEIPKAEKFHFHRRTGTNIELSNDRRTATRKDPDRLLGDGSVITNRPLKDDEMLEVRLDRTMPKWGRSISLGVTTHLPSRVSFQNHWYWKKSGVWIYYLHNIFHNGVDVKPSYGMNLERLQSGDRIGLVVKKNRLLHFFINGVDQGAVPVNITKAVYGILDLHGSAVQATILLPTNNPQPKED